LTDFLPFVMTILIGVPLLRAAAQSERTPAAQAALFGIALPLVLAPFNSLTGDYYEMGSIIVSRLALIAQPDLDLARWRADDLFKLTGARFGEDGGGTAADALAMSAAFLLGCGLAWLTYAAGALWSDLLQRAGAGRRSAGAP